MSAPVNTDASDLIELLAGFGYDTTHPGIMREDDAFKVELFDLWGDSGALSTTPVFGCNCLRQAAEFE